MILPNEIDISDHGVTPKSKIQMFYRFHGSIISLTLNHKPVSRKFPFKTTAVRFETSSRLKFSVHFFCPFVRESWVFLQNNFSAAFDILNKSGDTLTVKELSLLFGKEETADAIVMENFLRKIIKDHNDQSEVSFDDFKMLVSKNEEFRGIQTAFEVMIPFFKGWVSVKTFHRSFLGKNIQNFIGQFRITMWTGRKTLPRMI